MTLGFRLGIALVAYDRSTVSEMWYEGGLVSASIVAPCSQATEQGCPQP